MNWTPWLAFAVLVAVSAAWLAREFAMAPTRDDWD